MKYPGHSLQTEPRAVCFALLGIPSPRKPLQVGHTEPPPPPFPAPRPGFTVEVEGQACFRFLKLKGACSLLLFNLYRYYAKIQPGFKHPETPA